MRANLVKMLDPHRGCALVRHTIDRYTLDDAQGGSAFHVSAAMCHQNAAADGHNVLSQRCTGHATLPPEIVFRLATAPSPRHGRGRAVRLAQGFEIVQSVFPGRKFTAASPMACRALCCSRHGIRPDSAAPPIGCPISRGSRSSCCATAPWSIAAMPPMCSTARCLRCASFALGDGSRRAPHHLTLAAIRS